MVASVTANPLPGDMRIGDVLAGKFRIERVLGSGGMGVVVEATHLGLEERVAMKLLQRRDFPSEEVMARFLQEARVAAKLKSPNVVRVTDVGEISPGVPYILMELLTGESLETLLERERSLSPERACSILLQVCEAVAVAHAAGVIHRDLKPGNLFVTRAEDGALLVKVLDFGISKVVTPEGASLTQTNAAMGSPLYMAPEQMRSARSVDQRSDIWALGVILYRCLSGQSPFEALTLPEVCMAVLEAQFTPLQALTPSVPTDLAQVVCRCLQVQPSDRYPDVAAFAQALAPFSERGAAHAARCRRLLEPSQSTLALETTDLGGLPVQPPPTDTAAAFARAWSIDGSKRRSAIGVAVALAAGGLVVGWLSTQNRQRIGAGVSSEGTGNGLCSALPVIVGSSRPHPAQTTETSRSAQPSAPVQSPKTTASAIPTQTASPGPRRGPQGRGFPQPTPSFQAPRSDPFGERK